MAYTINLTDGTIFATIADGTINTSSSMTLVGKNYAGYGEFLDENFIRLLENNANSTAPGAPLTGQLWWDETNALLKVYNGSLFKVISSTTSSASAPSNPITGDLWYDSTNAQLKIYTGSAFLLVGPAFTAGQGTSGAVVETVTDNASISHVVIKLYVNDSIVGIVSKDASFTPQAALTGFTTVRPGITLSTLVGAQVPLFQGTSTDSQLLDSLDSTAFLRSDENDTTTGTLGVLNDTGLVVGVDSDFKASVSGTVVTLQNQTQDGNILIRVNDGGSVTTAILVDGSTAGVTMPLTLTVTGNATGGNLITAGLASVTGNITGGNVTTAGKVTVNSGDAAIAIANGGTSGTGNIGATGATFNTIFAKATTAQYADVAERFAADEVYLPGTVVELGGSAEITSAQHPLSESVFGVISTRAAYLMNSGAGSDQTHPPVAITGRVPVFVLGVINKGDRLVAAGNGMARAALPGEATAFNTIGRALTAKTNLDQGVIEAIVTIK